MWGITSPTSWWKVRVVLELKCVDRLADEHMAQCMNYLIASGRNVCLLINFQKAKVQWKRILLRF